MLAFQRDITGLFWCCGAVVALLFVSTTSSKGVYSLHTTSSIFQQRYELFWDFMASYGGYMGM